ncbi:MULTISPECIES: hypothetical protein [unclassified Lactococcus]|uniref:hypothetical protein n=1 Tax=unclassified Lactococcus TaxID=2643510 RepID=UPI0012978704|nr:MULTISPECIES: hypothetical protein [unclassified Lactococcus]MQW23901.1 hypothetical protein [Lactococcus sp. dk101]
MNVMKLALSIIAVVIAFLLMCLLLALPIWLQGLIVTMLVLGVLFKNGDGKE